MLRYRGILFGVILLLVAGMLACTEPSKPTVQIVSPASGTQVAVGEQVDVEYRATDEVAVLRVDLEIGGQVVDSQNSPVAEGQPSLTGLLHWTPTQPGTYTLLVYAYNQDRLASDAVAVDITVGEAALPEPTVEGVESELSVTGSGSLAVTTHESGLVTTPSGARLSIPPGAVPPMDDGAAGTMVFSVEEVVDQVATLPQEFAQIGSVYRLGPEGFTFAVPLELTLPIPEGADLQRVLGAAYYDVSSGLWTLLPGAVDEAARTVSLGVPHFSDYVGVGLSSSSGGDFFSINGGWIEIVNPHSENMTTNDRRAWWGKQRPFNVHYGVCAASYQFDSQYVWSWNWRAPADWAMVIEGPDLLEMPRPERGEFWLPAGTYQLVEQYVLQEVQITGFIDLDYVPSNRYYSRNLGDVVLAPGQRLVFESNVPTGEWVRYFEENGFVEVGGYCGVPPTTSAGTGDIQVTLTWQAEADIDLFVQDPDGDLVWYNNTTVPSGGRLDRDNKCGDFIMGRPENIFWPAGGAPSGTYTVRVNYYGDCTGNTGPVEWTVRTVVLGMVQTFSGTLTAVGETQDVTTLGVP